MKKKKDENVNVYIDFIPDGKRDAVLLGNFLKAFGALLADDPGGEYKVYIAPANLAE